jgi:formylglycine-generating enzyme required for sulfatase activity/serine/threonine protein kinase
MPTVERHGDFELYTDQVLGRGAMGVVLWGKQVSLDRPVAVKILAPGADTDEQSRTRFQREARITAMLDPSCSIVAVYGAWQAEGRYHLAMEYVDGASLKDLLHASGRPPLGATLEIVHRVSVALKEAHGKNVLHRDLKPGNIMLTRSGGVKVVDFGIGKILGAKTALTVSGIVGTPYYMSPEQAKGQAVDGRTDIYSLGCILFELITGRPPFLGDSPMSVLYACTHEPLTPPRSLQPDIPEEVEAIAVKCLEKDPAARYQTAAELEAHLAQLKVKTPVGGGWRTGEPDGTATPGTTLVAWVKSAQSTRPLEKTLVVRSDTDRREDRVPVFDTDAPAASSAPRPATIVTPAPAPAMHPASTPGTATPATATPATTTPPALPPTASRLPLVLAAAALVLAGVAAAALMIRRSEPPIPSPSPPPAPVVVQSNTAEVEAARKRLEEERLAAERQTKELRAEQDKSARQAAEQKRLADEAAARLLRETEARKQYMADADTLWTDAQKDRDGKNAEAAKQKLEQLVQRYPGSPRAVEARAIIPTLERKGLRLESAPAGASVLVNGKPHETRTPVLLEKQPAGDYEVVFSLPGYAEQRQKASHRLGEDTIVRVTLKRLTGSLRVKVSPAGPARVSLLGGKDEAPVPPQTAAADGVAQIAEVPVGPYTLRVERDGCDTDESPVEVKAGAPLEIARTLREIPAEILVTSDPPGGTVYLDGREKGQTPLTLKEIVPGRYRLRITHAAAFDHEEELVLKGKVNTAREILLAPRGRVILEAHPAGSTVRLEGVTPGLTAAPEQALDKGPLALPVKPGRYAVTFRHPQAGVCPVDITVAAGEEKKVFADLWEAAGRDLELTRDRAGAIAAYEKSRNPERARAMRDEQQRLEQLARQEQEQRLRQEQEQKARMEQDQKSRQEQTLAALKRDGETALKAGRFEEAEKKLAEVVRARSDDAEAAAALAFVRSIPEGMIYLARNAQGCDELINPKDKSVMVLVPGGEFTMGAEDGRNDEKPVRRIHVDAFLMDKTEVTWGQFLAYCKAASLTPPPEPAWGIQHDGPVVLETWDEAKAYCAWAGKRLPTEAEWEKAARGTDGRKWPWGNAWDPQKANTNLLELDKAVPCGSYPAGVSPYGLLDMAGNVCEWCEDWWADTYDAKADPRNPRGPAAGRVRAIRGGSWHGAEDLARCAARFKKAPTARDRIIGFRGVRDLRR